MSKEAMKLALETAEGILNADWRKWDELASPAEFERWAKSRAYFMATILREALAEQPAQQEPVAGLLVGQDSDGRYVSIAAKAHADTLPLGEYKLYTSPPAQRTWVGLSDEEVKAIFDSVPTASCQSYDHWRSLVALAIENKLREKNT